MPSDIDICNEALDLIGASSITSLSDDLNRTEASVCNRNYQKAVYQVQRLFPWRSIRTRASLPADVATPSNSPYAYQYSVPADFLRFIEIFESDSTTKIRDYQLEGDKILTDSAAPIKLTYLRKDLNPNNWDELLQTAIAYRLAILICLRITQDKELRQFLWREYEQVLGEAKRTHAQEMHPVEFDLGVHDITTAHLRVT